jgi:hypothetical protein
MNLHNQNTDYDYFQYWQLNSQVTDLKTAYSQTDRWHIMELYNFTKPRMFRNRTK